MTDEREVVRALEAHLDALLPECEVVDRQLEIEEGPSAHLVCRDPDGRLHLVVLVEGGAERTVLLALDTLGFLRRHASVLARHVGVDAEAAPAPRLVLVAEHFSPRAIARLSPLLGEDVEPGVRLLEMRTIRSDNREALWFAPVSHTASEEGLVAPSFDDFVERLPEESRQLARALAGDLARTDPAIRCEPRRARVAWTLDGEEICGLSATSAGLRLELPGREPIALDSSAARLTALDAVMERVLERIRSEASGETDDDGDRDLLALAEPLQLLTPEELEAFRET